jgi:hypothetical protein
MGLEPAELPERSFAEVNRSLIEAGAQRRERFMAAFRHNGFSVADACAKAGVSRATYQRWRSVYPSWAFEVDRVRQAGYRTDAEEAADIDAGGLHKFQAWRAKYIGMDSDPGHVRIADAITNAKPGRITIVLAAPECGKTTTLVDYMTMDLAVNPNVRITYTHQSHEFAKAVVQRIQNRLLPDGEFPTLLERYGPFKGNREWSSDRFFHAQKTSDEADPTLRGRGIYSRAQGVRADKLLIDDIQDISTLTQTDRLFNILRQTFFTRAVGDAQVVMVGNRVDVGDIWERIMDEPGLRDLVDVVTVPAMEDGESLFPSIYTTDDWATKRKIVGDDVWFRNYVQNPKATKEATFRPDDIEACLSQKPQHRAQTHPGDGWWRFMGVDPALGGGTAVVSAAGTADHLLVVDATWRQGMRRNEQIYLLMNDHATRYEPNDVVFEIASLQKGMARDERVEEMAREHGFRLLEHQTSGRKMDPVLGVGAMASSFIRREIIIPADSEDPTKPHHSMEELVGQLSAWRPDVPTRLLKQDLVMALWFIWLQWREKVRNHRGDDDMWKTSGMPAAGPRVPTAPLLTRR